VNLTGDRNVAWADPHAPATVTTQRVFFGPDPFGLGGFQVAVANAATTPSKQLMRELFAERKGKTQVQLVVVVVNDGTAHLFGPDPQAPALELPVEQAQRQLQSVLSEPDVLAATERYAGFRKANDSTGLSGFTNSGLFATHHIKENVPKRTDWDALGNAARPLLGLRKKRLIEALGFRTLAGPNGTLLLSIDERPPRAIAVLLDDSEHFDSKAVKFQLSPVAFGLAVASRQEVPWLVVLRKDQIRLYPGRDGVGVGSKGQAETFFEVDLATIDGAYAALLSLIFSAAALAPSGSAEELLRDSARYASELGTRLRERIYDKIVPPLAVEIAQRLVASAELKLDAEGLSIAYRVTLRILFRLLFQAYAEDRGLLPSGRNEGFDANSLKTNARRLLDSDTDEFGNASTIWLDLVQVWNAIDQGNPQWQIPSYNGGLFTNDPVRSPEGALITRIELPDFTLGPALKSLLIDVSDDGILGPVDFRSLSVREFGTIYEGLLESALSLADEDLTVDSTGAWVPANEGDQVWATSGSVYFHTASGERKATGSYFTPKVVVDHLIERSVVPALEAHLEGISVLMSKGDAVTAARDFFDFRVADLAMGSGHFLVAAVDKIEALMRTFLTEHVVPGVTDELLRLAAVAKEALGTDDVAKSEVDEVGLLRRQIARRCVYGLDINPMAVELARLALWIHTFVPGLPMSNLDHGLVNANSLTGIGTVDEALDALVPGRVKGTATFFDGVIIDNLASAKTLLVDVANASEANKAEVEEGSRLLAQAREAADTARQIFDAAVAVRIGVVHPGEIMDEKSLKSVLDLPLVSETSKRLQPAHMPFLFPEVFIRSDPGFDVLLGNPPWEKVKIETDQWWGLRMPGLRSMPQKEKNEALKHFRVSRPDLERAFEVEQEQVLALNAVIKSGPFDLGSGDTDLYQAFAWRNWQLLRNGGRFGMVLPRGALSGSGLAAWRRTIIANGSFSDVCFLLNSQQWVFPEVHPQYTVGLTVVGKGGDHVVRWSGPFASEKEFTVGAANLAEVSAEEFSTWSSTAAFPLIPDPVSAEIFRQMKKSPRFDAARSDWEFRPLRELDATGDKSVLEFDTDADRGRIPVFTGASFNLWDPDAANPYAYAKPQVLRPYLAKKLDGAIRNSRSAYYRLRHVPSVLPMDFARIAFRDIARATDTRTMICALLPPGSTAVHKAPVLVRRSGNSQTEAALLGIMSSIPFDWVCRRWVELTMSFELVNGLPVPRPDLKAPIGLRLVEIAGRLAAVDERYADWANEVGVPTGSLNSDVEKYDLVAELDALVSLLYGLDEDQVEHVFATFHRGWAYESRLEAVLRHFRAWRGKV
jgi:hypothetical protein